MSSLIVGSSREGDYIALTATANEVEELHEKIKLEEKEHLFRNLYPVKHIVAIGNPRDTTDDEIRKYIRFRLREGDKLYACHCPEPHYTVNHYNAISSWYCALQALGYPSFVVMVLAPRIIDPELAEPGLKKLYPEKKAIT